MAAFRLINTANGIDTTGEATESQSGACSTIAGHEDVKHSPKAMPNPTANITIAPKRSRLIYTMISRNTCLDAVEEFLLFSIN